MNTRRQFLIQAPLGVLVAAAACTSEVPQSATPGQSAPSTPGAPPTFGTGAGTGPEVTPATFAEAEKLMQVTQTQTERQLAAESWRRSFAPYLERRTGPRKVALADADVPATLWNPALPVSRRLSCATDSFDQCRTPHPCRRQTMQLRLRR
jgi:hypothetical protein